MNRYFIKIFAFALSLLLPLSAYASATASHTVISLGQAPILESDTPLKGYYALYEISQPDFIHEGQVSTAGDALSALETYTFKYAAFAFEDTVTNYSCALQQYVNLFHSDIKITKGTMDSEGQRMTFYLVYRLTEGDKSNTECNTSSFGVSESHSKCTETSTRSCMTVTTEQDDDTCEGYGYGCGGEGGYDGGGDGGNYIPGIGGAVKKIIKKAVSKPAPKKTQPEPKKTPRQKEYESFKNKTDGPTPAKETGESDKDYYKRLYNYYMDLASEIQAWDDKYKPGDHTQKIQDQKNRANKYLRRYNGIIKGENDIKKFHDMNK